MTRGFTLLELLVVVVLLGLLAGAGLFGLDGLSARRRVETSGRCIQQAFRLARHEAIASGLPRRLLLDPQAHAAVLCRPQIDAEGLTWRAGPRLAWSPQVTLQAEGPAPRFESAEGRSWVVSLWPDGTSQACQLQLQEAGQRMQVTIGGRQVTCRWVEADAASAEPSN